MHGIGIGQDPGTAGDNGLHQPAHIIVTDLHMPEMSGVDLCQWLRQQVTTAKIPIVLCSSLPEAELAKVASQVGADAYLFCTAELEGQPVRLVARVDARNVPERGERVSLRPLADAAHLFDGETGERLGS